MLFWKSKMIFPGRRNLTFHLAKPYLSQGETLSFTKQNLIFHKAKPYLSQGETISFTRWNLIFHKAKPYLSQGETLSFARRNHIFCKVIYYVLQHERLSFVSLENKKWSCNKWELQDQEMCFEWVISWFLPASWLGFRHGHLRSRPQGCRYHQPKAL